MQFAVKDNGTNVILAGANHLFLCVMSEGAESVHKVNVDNLF